MSEIPKVVIVGGPDVDSRLDLMHALEDEFEAFLELNFSEEVVRD